MLRSQLSGQQGRGGKAGGKEGKRNLGERAQKALREANALAAAGNAVEAAASFHNIASIASDRGKPAVAGFLALRAASTQLDSGDHETAIESTKIALSHTEGMSAKRRIALHFRRFLTNLQKIDADAATNLTEEVRSRLGLKSLPVPGEGLSPNRQQRRSLSKTCPTCKVSIDRKSIRFEEDGTVDCPQCGDTLA